MDTVHSVSPFQKILFCTDFSENADYAFDFAVDAAVRRPGCTLYLLHVIPETDAQFWKTYLYEVENVDQKAKQRHRREDRQDLPAPRAGRRRLQGRDARRQGLPDDPRVRRRDRTST